jgi:medium-chain acyl-[acyl-carrier-protein] hydrolase
MNVENRQESKFRLPGFRSETLPEPRTLNPPLAKTEGFASASEISDYPQWTGTFAVRSADLGADGRVGAATVLGFLNEGAASHAQQLGVGLHALQESGRTWMLARMRVVFLGWPSLDDALTVKTWPAGVRGRAVAYRDFEGRNGVGNVIVKAISEWLLVDTEKSRILRLPPEITSLAPAETPRVELPEAEPPAAGWEASWHATLPVRRADLDVNRHVNNGHYAEWLFEPLPAAWLERRLTRVDIAYRLGAVQGDTVVSAAAVGETTVAHRLTRLSDGAVLVEAATWWDG